MRLSVFRCHLGTEKENRKRVLYLTAKGLQSTTSNWNTYRPTKSVPVRGSVPVRDNPYNFAYKATLHIKIALFCGQIRW